MKIEQIDEVIRVLQEIKKLETLGWKIDNISLQYIQQGQINLRLLKKKDANFETSNSTSLTSAEPKEFNKDLNSIEGFARKR